MTIRGGHDRDRQSTQPSNIAQEARSLLLKKKQIERSISQKLAKKNSVGRQGVLLRGRVGGRQRSARAEAGELETGEGVEASMLGGYQIVALSGLPQVALWGLPQVPLWGLRPSGFVTCRCALVAESQPSSSETARCST